MDRNVRIVSRVANGESLQQVADDEGITKQRVSQICQENQDEVPDDASREVQWTQLEGLWDVVSQTIRNPGFVISPGGGVVCELTGELDNRNRPIPDPSRPLINKELRIKAVEVALRVLERKSRLHGLDLTKQRQQDQSGEMADFLAHVEEQGKQVIELTSQNAELRRQLGMAELIPEAEIVS